MSDYWIQTWSGRKFDLLEPHDEDVWLLDIAEHLSRLCRFNGAVRPQHYSVAQHSVLASRLVDPELAREALLHDAHEAYTGDITRPMKMLLNAYSFGLVSRIEATVQAAIAKRYGLSPAKTPDVDRVDGELLIAERDQLTHMTAADWGPSPQGADVTINPWPQDVACERFLLRAQELGLE